jgi:serine/threonine-protein kinase SRPK3
LKQLVIIPTKRRDDEILRTITELIGPMPPDWLKRWPMPWRADYVDEKGALLPDLVDRKGRNRYNLPRQMARDRPAGMGVEEWDIFYDFMCRMIRWRPQERATAAELLEHQWIKDYAMNA